MHLKQVERSESLEDIARIGIVFVKEIENGAVDAELARYRDELISELRQAVGERKLSEIDAVARTRRLYHSVGIDPTRDRPSSERLLRRILRERPLPEVDRLTETLRLVSLRLQCPLGIYDWDRVAPPVLVRIGRPEEGYEIVDVGTPVSPETGAAPSRNRWNLHGRLAVVDGEGLFGNPSHDSERTRVGPGTVRALVLAWAPAEAPRSYLEGVIDEIGQSLERHCSAKIAASGIL